MRHVALERVALFASIVAATLSFAGDPFGISDTVKMVVTSSPDRYFAGLVEVQGAGDCWKDGSRTVCADVVAIVESFVAHESGRQTFPSRFQLLSGRQEGAEPTRGTRYLIVAAPLPDRPAFGAKAMTSDTTPERIDSWKAQALAAVRTSPKS